MNQPYGPGHLSYLQTQITRPLTVFVPPLRRQIPKIYADQFWSDGSIRLSCFAAFARLEGAGQQDRSEGHGFYSQTDLQADRSIGAYTMAGGNAFALSFTTIAALDAEFGDGHIDVVEAVGFCAEVANMIPGCTSAMIGPCIYRENKVLAGTGPAPKIEDLLVGDGTTNVDSSKLFGAIEAMQGPIQYFLKEDTAIYRAQGEFRMIWETNKPVNEGLSIKAEALRTFCRR